jgi:hypothetical protein
MFVNLTKMNKIWCLSIKIIKFFRVNGKSEKFLPLYGKRSI